MSAQDSGPASLSVHAGLAAQRSPRGAVQPTPSRSSLASAASGKLHLKTVATLVKPWWSMDNGATQQSKGHLLDTHSLTLLDKVYAGSPRNAGDSASPVKSPRHLTYEESVAAEDKRELKREHDKKVGMVVHAFELLEALLAAEAQPDALPDKRLEAAMCSALYAFPFFQHFDDEDLIQLVKLCDPLRVPKGSTLFVQDDEDEDSVFFILHGAISIHFHPTHSPERLQANADSWAAICHGRENNAAGKEIEDLFGTEAAVEGPCSVLGANALLDKRLMRHKPSGTAIASSNNVCALKLSRRVLQQNGLLSAVLSRTLHVMNKPEYRLLVKFTKTEPNLRTSHHLDLAREMVNQIPFFMNFHGSARGPKKCFDALLRHLIIDPELTKTEILWHEGSTIDGRRFELHIILKGNVQHYCKGTSVDPLQLSSIDWDDKESISAIIGNESAFVTRVGNVVGGPAELSQNSAVHTVVAMEGTVVARVNKLQWKRALTHMDRPFLYTPGVVRRALADFLDASNDSITPLPALSRLASNHRTPSREFSRQPSYESPSGMGGGWMRQMSFADLPSASHFDTGQKTDKAERLAVILRESFRFFAQLPLKKLAQLSSKLRFLHVPSHEVLCLKGDDCEGVFVMLVGMAMVYSEDGKILEDRTHATKMDTVQQRHSFQTTIAEMRAREEKVPVLQGERLAKFARKASAKVIIPSKELETMGHKYQELTCGDVLFEREAAHSLPYSASVVAGDSDFDIIFIDAATYMQLASPFAPETPPLFISRVIAMQRTALIEQNSEDEIVVAQALGKVPGLDHLDAELLQGLAKHCKTHRLPTEALVLKQGSKSSGFFVLLEGAVSIHDPLRGEKRVQHGCAGLTSTLGSCIRKGVPGEEPFGLTSMILSSENLWTVACSATCLFYTIEQEDFSADLYRKFHSACRKIIQRPEYMQRPREERMDHHILINVNYLRENPFFCSLNAAAQQRLANTIELQRLSKGDAMPKNIVQLAVVNHGSIGTFTAGADSVKIKAVRQLPFRQDQSRGGTKSTASLDVVKGSSDEWGSGSGFGRATSSAGSFSRLGSSAGNISRIASATSLSKFSRVPSTSKVRSKWSTVRMLSTSSSSSATLSAAEDAPVFVEHVVAAYGQGFWSGMLSCFADVGDTEVFLVSKAEWRKITSMLSTSDLSDVSIFLSSHPCFQGLKHAEIQALMQHTKLVHLDERSVLFNRKDTVSDVFFLREGSLHLQTDIALDRTALSAGEQRVIPNITVASLQDSAIINDVIDLTTDSPVDVLRNWSAHSEKYTAMAFSKCIVVALNKLAVLTLLSAERRAHMLRMKQDMDSFNMARCGVVALSRDSMLHGRIVAPWSKPERKQIRGELDIIDNFRQKTFARHMPPTYKPSWAAELPSEDVPSKQRRCIDALVSPRFVGVQLPRRSGISKLSVSSVPHTSTPMHFSNDARRDMAGEGIAWRAGGDPAGTSTRKTSNSERKKREIHSIGNYEMDTLRDCQESLELCAHQEGETPRQRYLRNGRPGNLGLSVITRSQIDRLARVREMERQDKEERDDCRRRIQIESGQATLQQGDEFEHPGYFSRERGVEGQPWPSRRYSIEVRRKRQR